MQAKLLEQGFELVKSKVDPSQLSEYREAFAHYLSKTCLSIIESHSPEGLERLAKLSFVQQLAHAIGITGGDVLHQIEPVLNSKLQTFTWSEQLPSPFIPELFNLIKNESVLNSLEPYLGPQINATPIWHNNIKLPPSMLQLAGSIAKAHGHNLQGLPNYQFTVGITGWHRDLDYLDTEAQESNIINVWIPMTSSTVKNGCLLVIPGSHLEDNGPHPTQNQLSQRIPVEAEPGDILLIDKRLYHAAHNTHKEKLRWAFNCRYSTEGEPSGRNYLPTMKVRGKGGADSDIWTSEVWSQAWHDALGKRRN